MNTAAGFFHKRIAAHAASFRRARGVHALASGRATLVAATARPRIQAHAGTGDAARRERAPGPGRRKGCAARPALRQARSLPPPRAPGVYSPAGGGADPVATSDAGPPCPLPHLLQRPPPPLTPPQQQRPTSPWPTANPPHRRRKKPAGCRLPPAAQMAPRGICRPAQADPGGRNRGMDPTVPVCSADGSMCAGSGRIRRKAGSLCLGQPESSAPG